jgi:hypothetical protein
MTRIRGDTMNKPSRWTIAMLLAAGILTPAALWGQMSADDRALAPEVYEALPVREVTVFKDGHSFMLHAGTLPTNAVGNVELDRLPRPVLGTFWPYATGAQLTGVVAGRRRMAVERTALNLVDLLRANVGKQAEVTVTTASDRTELIEGTISGFPQRSAAELAATRPPDSEPALPQLGELVLLQTGRGERAIPVARILDVMLLETPETSVSGEEWRNVMTLRLEGAPAGGRAEVGLVYLQRGLRWIPQYRVILDDDGQAEVELQATLINELTDLADVKAQLVVGVPSFKFQDDVDPISLEQTVARLSSVFRQDSQFLNISNAIMTQQVMPARNSQPQSEAPALDLGPDIGGDGRNEDLFLYSVEHLTLARGERMTVPLVSFTIPYEDVYTVSIPFGVPLELVRNLNNDQQREAAQLLARPRATHAARLENKSPYPLTTAPALILMGERLLAQGLMTYTPVGARVDLPITTAVDVQVDKDEEETGRQPNAVRMNNNDFTRVNLRGRLRLANYRREPIRLEASRYLLGVIDSVSGEGRSTNGNVFDDGLMLEAMGSATWWMRFSWPWWWASLNGLGRASWEVSLEPGQTVELEYTWHYFWD